MGVRSCVANTCADVLLQIIVQLRDFLELLTVENGTIQTEALADRVLVRYVQQVSGILSRQTRVEKMVPLVMVGSWLGDDGATGGSIYACRYHGCKFGSRTRIPALLAR